MIDYERVNWEDLPSTDTPLNADNLNRMDSAIAELCDELSTYSTAMDEQSGALDLLERRYDIIWRAIEEFIQNYSGGGDTSGLYPRIGGEVYGPVTTSRYFQADKSGWTAQSAGFRINANGYGGFNIAATRTEVVNQVTHTYDREVVFGITDGGLAGIFDRTKLDKSNQDEPGSWIVRAMPPEFKSIRVRVDHGDDRPSYKTETVKDFDVSIPHPFKCKNFEASKSALPPILTSDSVGYRISKMQTYSNGQGKMRIYGDWGNDDYWTTTDGSYDDRARVYGADYIGWSAEQGWPDGNAAFANTDAITVNLSTSDIRLKENVEDSNFDALDLLMSLPMRQFDWKSGGHWDVGFIADEIEKLDPHLAEGGGYDDEGHMVVKTVNSFYLEGVMTKALQQAVKRIEVLEFEVAKLKAKG